MSSASAIHPEALLARAGQAFGRGDLETARQLAEGAAELPQARHLLAIIERRSGNLEASRAHFESTLPVLSDDPSLNNNYANLLVDCREPENALRYYRRAVELQPDYLDALTNLGKLAKDLGYFDEARDVLERALRIAPESARVWQLLGLLLRETGDLDDSAAAFERAVRLAPQDPKIAHARAVVESSRGGGGASLYDTALRLDPGNLSIYLGKASALLAEGDFEGSTRLLADLLRQHPDWLLGHLTLTQIRWQIGEGEASARSYDEALAIRPGDLNILLAKISTFHRARRYREVLELVESARRDFGHRSEIHDALDRLEAVAADENGDAARAARLFSRLPVGQDAELRFPYIRHLLRTGRPAEAASMSEEALKGGSSRLGWSLLATAWRLMDDPRWEWLEGDPRFVMSIDIEEIIPHLPELGERLRELHVLRVHPFDQSLVGGTQTDGHLLIRSEPVIRKLRDALDRAVAAYIEQLPPHDPAHPLLMEPRDRGFRFVGAWSVRLASQGFHINHVHPEGWISSALYVSLPSTMGDSGNPAGWLQLGVPSVELGLDLKPFRLIEPKPGRLALFPSTMWHGTLPFEDGERLTVAFDVRPRTR